MDLHARTDARFVDAIYKLLISHFNYTPSLKKTQFLCHGQFMERRMMMIVDCVRLVAEKHNSLVRSTGSLKSRSSASLADAVELPEHSLDYEDENEMPAVNVPLFAAPVPLKQAADPLRLSIDERRKALSDFQRSIQYPMKKQQEERDMMRASLHLDSGIQTEPMQLQDETEDFEYYDNSESDDVAVTVVDEADFIEIKTLPRETAADEDSELFASVDELARRHVAMTLDELEPEIIREPSPQIDGRNLHEDEDQESPTFEVLQQAVEQVKSLTEMMISFMDRLDRIESQHAPRQPADQASQ